MPKAPDLEPTQQRIYFWAESRRELGWQKSSYSTTKLANLVQIVPFVPIQTSIFSEIWTNFLCTMSAPSVSGPGREESMGQFDTQNFSHPIFLVSFSLCHSQWLRRRMEQLSRGRASGWQFVCDPSLLERRREDASCVWKCQTGRCPCPIRNVLCPVLTKFCCYDRMTTVLVAPEGKGRGAEPRQPFRCVVLS
eukprot:516999-Rhodomonas_salina.2